MYSDKALRLLNMDASSTCRRGTVQAVTCGTAKELQERSAQIRKQADHDLARTRRISRLKSLENSVSKPASSRLPGNK